MSVPQITIRLSPEAKAEFERYASGLGMRASELAKLLIVRERHQRRLLMPKSDAKVAERRHRSVRPRERPPTVTAHLSSVGEVESFNAYAVDCGLNRSSAGAKLLEAELRDR